MTKKTPVKRVAGQCSFVVAYAFLAHDSICAEHTMLSQILMNCIVSVTQVDQSNTVKVRIKQFSLYNSPIPLDVAG